MRDRTFVSAFGSRLRFFSGSDCFCHTASFSESLHINGTARAFVTLAVSCMGVQGDSLTASILSY